MADKKFSPMRYTASTEEAAVQGALQIVGASRDEIEYEVLDQSEKGVTVRIKPRSSDAPSQPAPAPSEAPAAAAPVEAVAATAPIAEDVPELLAQDESDEDAGEGELDAAPAEFEAQSDEAESELESDYDEPEAAYEEEAPVAQPVEVAPVVPLNPELVARAQQQAQEFLDRMGLEASVRLGQSPEANTAALIIEGADVGILIGKHGATLQSFQYLLNLTLNAHNEGEGMRVVVDAGNYRARRQSSLEQTARSAASKARREGRSIRLEPMPAHERRLVHMYLQTESDVLTQSEGREPMRRIVVSPSSGGRSSSPRSGTERSSGGERTFGNDRSYGERRGGGGMGSYGRREGGGNGGNRGYNRGR